MKKIKLTFMALLSVFIFGGTCLAQRLSEAQSLYDKGEYIKAENVLSQLINNNPNDPEPHQLLGSVYRRTGRLKEAIAEYDKASRLGAENSELHKGYATVYRYMREYAKAEAEYLKALQIKPDDKEAAIDLDSLRKRRGLKLRLAAGGLEPDYTTKSYEANVMFSGFGRLDVNVGYSFADQIYYSRHKVFGNAYYYFKPTSYVKAGITNKEYEYPLDPALKAANPDSNSYDIVNSFELEVSHWITHSVRATAGYEFFRPNFFHDRNTFINNHKFSFEGYFITPYDPLRLKIMYAILRDPDPSKSFIAGRGMNLPLGQVAPSTSITYQTQSLLGFGVEYQYRAFNAEAKYMPNRDLDASYSDSFFLSAGYDFADDLSARVDLVHDIYSSQSNYANRTADVYMLSGKYAVDAFVEVGGGYKRVKLPSRSDDVFFVNLIFLTGLSL